MKKILLVFIFSVEFLLAGVWSSSGEDGINQ